MSIVQKNYKRTKTNTKVSKKTLAKKIDNKQQFQKPLNTQTKYSHYTPFLNSVVGPVAANTRGAKYMANQKTKIAVIGSGWFGFESALALKKLGYDVTVFEAGENGPVGTSTKYSCHTHPTGSHYNRLPAEFVQLFIDCYKGFKKHRSEFLRHNNNSINGIVETDSNNQPSRTSPEKFRARCMKYDRTARDIDSKDFGMRGFHVPIAIDEERIINGEEFIAKVIKKYDDNKIKFNFGTQVNAIDLVKSGYKITYNSKKNNNHGTLIFDKVVNATGFQKFIPPDFQHNPFALEVVYQPVVALVYKDTEVDEKEMFSLLLLDGSNPCLMPTANSGEYFLTHCGLTLLGSFASPEEAWDVFENRVNEDFIKSEVQPKVENEIKRYLENFDSRFQATGYNGGVIAKPKTANELRLGFAFQSPDGIIHTFPGKITSAWKTALEVTSLVAAYNVVEINNYILVKGGTLYKSLKEISNKPEAGSNLHNACTANPYDLKPAHYFVNNTNGMFNDRNKNNKIESHDDNKIHSIKECSFI